jgi:hypothetical protein
MPDDYIIYRENHKHNGADEWKSLYSSLTPYQKEEFHGIVYENQFNNGACSKYPKVNALLVHYKESKGNAA